MWRTILRANLSRMDQTCAETREYIACRPDFGDFSPTIPLRQSQLYSFHWLTRFTDVRFCANYRPDDFARHIWDSWSDDLKKKWDPAMNLGEAGRKTIKNHDLDYYLNILHDTREHSLAEFRIRDDQWLLSNDTEQFDSSGKINIYWKWFHVCEHESHQTRQIAFLTKRLPSAKATPVARKRIQTGK